MNPKRRVFTIIAEIKVDPQRPNRHMEELRGLLASIENNKSDNGILPLDFKTFPELHFASFIIFPGDRDRGGSNADLLVFEHSVEIPVNDYIQNLAQHDGLDRIYCHCDEFEPGRGAAYRESYFHDHAKTPELHHVSTAFRTARGIRRDGEIRAELDAALQEQMPKAVARQMAADPQAIFEYWTWESVKPAVAVALAVTLLVIEIWLAKHLTWSHWRRVFDRSWWNVHHVVRDVVILADVLFLGFSVGNAALGLWYTSRIDMRRRVYPWIRYAAITTLAVFIGVRYRSSYPGRVIALGAVWGVMLVWQARDVLYECKGIAIAAMQVGSAPVSPMPLWNGLRAISNPYVREAPTWGQRILSWSPWPLIAGLTTLIGVYVHNRIVPAHRDAVVIALITFFYVETIWLTLLVGWPLTSEWQSPRIKWIIRTTVAAAVVIISLFVLHAGGVLIGLSMPILWFELQGLSIPTPRVETLPATQSQLERINAVIEQEDLDVQNHMALEANIGRSRIARWSLKLYLSSLYWVFFRSVLRHLWGGKLFGIPTVHSAQWVLLNDGRYFFLSNYDHSFSAYLNDFGLEIPTGVQKIWGQAKGNPGMGDVERFKLFVRKAMVPHEVWYRAYPELSLRQLWNNEQLRRALARDNPDEDDVHRALRRLGASPKIIPDIFHGAK